MPRRCRSGLKFSAATMRAAGAPACERGRPEEDPGKLFSAQPAAGSPFA